MRVFRGRPTSGAWTALLVLGFIASALPAASAQRTYTLDGDFAEGTLINLNYTDVANQLQINQGVTGVFPFINVAASGRGTIVRLNTDTGAIVGEYYTSPAGRGRDPSRTTVDQFGNVWAGNRGEDSQVVAGVPPNKGSVVKVGLIVGGTRVNADGTPNPVGEYLQPPYSYNTCQDRNGDGLIRTSRGLGNLLAWTNVGGVDTDGGVDTAADECILIYQRTNARQVRHVSVDGNNDVWVGGFPGYVTQWFDKLDGDTGAILAGFNSAGIGCGGYGGLVDGNGILWSASLGSNRVLRYDPAAATGACIGGAYNTYGMGIDTNGFIWNSLWTGDRIDKLSPLGVRQAGFPKAASLNDSRGVVVTSVDNNVWVANSSSNSVTRLANDGTVRKEIPVGAMPTGVAVDKNGKVWVTNANSDNVMRINPAGGADGLGAVDLMVSLGGGAYPYNYSDMTGAVVTGATLPKGTWTVVYDGGAAGVEWGTIDWNQEPQGSTPPGTSIMVEARAAESQAGLAGLPFVQVFKGLPFDLTGRYIEVRATLFPDNEAKVSPILSDLTVAPIEGIPGLVCDVDKDGDIDKIDLSLISRARGQAAIDPFDPRDADGDGLITPNDTKVCIPKCTRPYCAIQ